MFGSWVYVGIYEGKEKCEEKDQDNSSKSGKKDAIEIEPNRSKFYVKKQQIL